MMLLGYSIYLIKNSKSKQSIFYIFCFTNIHLNDELKLMVRQSGGGQKGYCVSSMNFKANKKIS